jgi:hypothetical protein
MVEDFAYWLEDLEVQTLTDELKGDIIDKVRDIMEEIYESGVVDGRQLAITDIQNAIENL